MLSQAGCQGRGVGRTLTTASADGVQPCACRNRAHKGVVPAFGC